MASSTDRLLSQLNATQLQQKDNPTYQVIKQLINRIKELEGLITSGSTTNITNETIQQYFINEGDGGSGDSDIGPPGIKGDTGAIGPTGAEGPPFPAFYMMESDSPEEIMPIPGSQGIQGVAGDTGAAGSSFPFMLPEPDMGEDPLFMLPQIGSLGWTLIATQVAAGAAQYDFTGLGQYSEILVICRNITRSVSGITSLRVSTDNGSTFLSTSGDYVDLSAAGIDTNLTLIAFHTTNATAARSGWITIQAFNKATTKPTVSTDVNNYLITTASLGADTALNAIRVFSGLAGGNLNAGTIYVYGR